MNILYNIIYFRIVRPLLGPSSGQYVFQTEVGDVIPSSPFSISWRQFWLDSGGKTPLSQNDLRSYEQGECAY